MKKPTLRIQSPNDVDKKRRFSINPINDFSPTAKNKLPNIHNSLDMLGNSPNNLGANKKKQR